jgi:Tol biopolymer transport system component
VVLGACGFRSQAGGPDAPGGGSDAGPPGDGPGGGPGDGSGTGDGSSGATDCLARWTMGPPAIAAVDELTGLSTTADDRDPWISSNGLRLYFSREPGTHGKTDVFLASRGAAADAFTSAAQLDNLSTPDHEDRPALTTDENTLVLSSDHGTSGGRFEIFITTRSRMTDPFGSPSQDHLDMVNSSNDDKQDPFLSADGKTLYLAPDPSGAAQPRIVSWTRAANGDFETPKVVVDSGSGDADPAVTPDERILVFSSRRPGGAGQFDLWYATRGNKTDSFGGASRIPMVNSTGDDVDPVLGADGCDLYFSSNRDPGGTFHLFHARVMK